VKESGSVAKKRGLGQGLGGDGSEVGIEEL